MKSINKSIVPLLVSTLLMVVSVSIVSFSNYKLNIKHYIGFGLLIISYFFYFKKKDIYIKLFGIILLLGLIGLINFYYTSIIVKLGILKFNPIFMVLLLLFFTVDKDNIYSLVFNKNINTTIEPNKESIQNFKLRFKDKPTEKLQNIMKEHSKYSTEAKIAAELILKER